MWGKNWPKNLVCGGKMTIIMTWLRWLFNGFQISEDNGQQWFVKLKATKLRKFNKGQNACMQQWREDDNQFSGTITSKNITRVLHRPDIKFSFCLFASDQINAWRPSLKSHCVQILKCHSLLRLLRFLMFNGQGPEPLVKWFQCIIQVHSLRWLWPKIYEYCDGVHADKVPNIFNRFVAEKVRDFQIAI